MNFYQNFTDFNEKVTLNFFSPLAGPNRAVYFHVLKRLYDFFYIQPYEDVLPWREEVRQEIDESMLSLSAKWLPEDQADDHELAKLPDMPIGSRIYRRLLACGWLEEEPEGYRARVLMSPLAGKILAVLCETTVNDHGYAEITYGEPVYYGGVILTIFNNITLALQEPSTQALAMVEAARLANKFYLHLHGMVYGLKSLLLKLGKVAQYQDLLATFFDNFVTNFLIADYKKLKTENNPFRYRLQVLGLLNKLQMDKQLWQALQDGYKVHLDLPDNTLAALRLQRDHNVLRNIFQKIEQQLDRIDACKYKFERRAADVVRYLESSNPLFTNKISAILAGFAADAHRADHEEILTVPFFNFLPIADCSAYRANKITVAPNTEINTTVRLDKRQYALQQLVRAYIKTRKVHETEIVAYINKNLGKNKYVQASDMQINSVTDYFCFVKIRQLSLLHGAALQQKHKLLVTMQHEIIENHWLKCCNFTVERTKEALC